MCNTQDIFDMKKAFLLLLALSGFVACKQESPQEPKPTPTPTGELQLATGPTTTVTLNLEGELDPEEAKALSLNPRKKGGKSILRPEFQGGEKLKAIWTVYKDKVNYLQGEVEGTIEDNKFSFYKDITLPDDYIDPANADQIYFSLHIGDFKKVGGKYTLQNSSLVAPYYEHGATHVTNSFGRFPVVFKSNLVLLRRVDSRGNVVGSSGNARDVKSIAFVKNHSLKFSLAGVLLNTKVVNETSETVNVEQIHVYGFGAKGTYLTVPQGNLRPTLAGDPVSAGYRPIPINDTESNGPRPASYSQLPPKTSKNFLVYVPSDGFTSNTGRLEVSLRETQLNGKKFSFDKAEKTLSPTYNSKVVKTTVTIRPGAAAIDPNAIPLQYWNNQAYYKEGGTAYVTNYQNDLFKRNFVDGQAAQLGRPGFFHKSGSVTADEVNRNSGGSYHIPYEYEFRGVIPALLHGSSLTDFFYDNPMGHSWSWDSDAIIVAGRWLVGSSQFYRVGTGRSGDVTKEAINTLFWEGALSDFPIYAIRFAKTPESEIQRLKNQGFTDDQIIKDNKSRVGYMYIYRQGGITVRSVYIGDNPSIKTPADLRNKLGRENIDKIGRDEQLNGHKIYHREIPYLGVRYNGAAPVYHKSTRDKIPGNGTISKIIFSTHSVGNSYPPSGYSIITGNETKISVGLIFEGQSANHPSNYPSRIWKFGDKTAAQVGSGNLSVPVFVFSNSYSTTQIHENL